MHLSNQSFPYHSMHCVTEDGPPAILLDRARHFSFHSHNERRP